LLEVLIATFVLSIGLLGLASLIPVGRFAMVETAKSDRSGACGRAALRDVQVCQMVNPFTWRHTVNAAGTANANLNLNPAVDAATGFFQAPGLSYAIDPLLIASDYAANVTTNLGTINYFPYSTAVPALATMRRVTLAGLLAAGLPSLPLAERGFRWRDDLLFDIPKDADLRPHVPLDAAGNPLPNAHEGSYSWLVTVTPDTAETGMPAGAKRRYIVSAVVFYKRDLAVEPAATTPSERTVTANMIGGGYSGGDVLLTSPNAAWLEVRENQWLMLCGQSRISTGPGTTRAGPGVFRWYRIVAAGEIDTLTDPNRPRRYVTLAGPDWNINAWCSQDNNQVLNDDDNDGTHAEAEAALFGDAKQGVVGVYSTTVELN
jgi:hypothetical protein